MAIPSGELNLTRGINAEIGQLTFELTDPIAYGKRKSVTIGRDASSEVTFLVNGTSKTYLIITDTLAIRDSSTSLYGFQIDDGDFLNVQFSSPSGSTVIDCERRIITRSGQLEMPTLNSSWFEVEPGIHTLKRLYGSSGASYFATIEYDERWL